MRSSQQDTINLLSNMIRDQIPWMVVGSFSCTVQGMDWQPNDIDVVTTEKGYEVFKEKLSSFGGAEEEKSRGNFTWKEFNVSIKGESVSIFCELGKDKIYTEFLLKGFKKKVSSDGGVFYCLWIEKEAEGYRKAGRINKAEEIEKLLAKRKSNFLDTPPEQA